MEEIKLTKADQQYENALGLFSLSNDYTEEFTPNEFLRLDKKYHPIFVIRPLKPDEREQYQRFTTKMSVLNRTDYDFTEKVIDINKKVGEVVCKAVLDIKNFYEIKNRKFFKKNFELVDGHISAEDLNGFTELLKALLFERVSTLSGFSRSDRASL